MFGRRKRQTSDQRADSLGLLVHCVGVDRLDDPDYDRFSATLAKIGIFPRDRTQVLAEESGVMFLPEDCEDFDEEISRHNYCEICTYELQPLLVFSSDLRLVVGYRVWPKGHLPVFFQENGYICINTREYSLVKEFEFERAELEELAARLEVEAARRERSTLMVFDPRNSRHWLPIAS